MCLNIPFVSEIDYQKPMPPPPSLESHLSFLSYGTQVIIQFQAWLTFKKHVLGGDVYGWRVRCPKLQIIKKKI